MSMSLPNEIISRVKRTWDFLRPGAPLHKPLRNADPLIKMNLPPLMGRRDAAYDCADKLFSDDLFAREEAERSRLYTIGNGLMQQAAEDTRAILRMLSRPDTESRERGILHFVLLIGNISQTLGDSLELQDELLQDEAVSPLKELGVTLTEAELVRSEKFLGDYEVSVINQLRIYFERASLKINRYRGYTHKSFSPANASRYRKAYEAYTRIYSGEA